MMVRASLPRQFITDAEGEPIAVILPIEEYTLIKPILDQRDRITVSKLQELEAAANDPAFMSDLEETMQAFEDVDSEWWELVA